MARKCRVRVENVDVFVAPRVPLRTPEPHRRAGDGLPRRSRPSPRRRSREGLVANDCALWERRPQIWTSNETGGFTLSRDDVIRYRGSSFLRHLRCLLIKAFDQVPKQWSARSFPTSREASGSLQCSHCTSGTDAAYSCPIHSPCDQTEQATAPGAAHKPRPAEAPLLQEMLSTTPTPRTEREGRR